MVYFIGGIILLVVGYFTYGKYVQSILGPDDRETPAVKHADGVDYVVLPQWKNMLIQLLNIAGIGPVIGVILGIKFGLIVFILIPVGNILGGAVHDFLSGMMSLRSNGANLPQMIRENLGEPRYRLFSVFMSLILLLVVAVFINVPAGLIDKLYPEKEIFWFAAIVIFLYYIVATLFPVDKIIGRIYPLFGLMLLIGSAALFVALVIAGCDSPELFTETAAFKKGMFTEPVVPCLFVTIACGILSGFHATQSPIIARTMKSEKEARANFYGMMIVEGIIGMIWAAGGMAIYNLFPEYMAQNPNNTLLKITTYFLGNGMGKFTVFAVIVLAITSGDTALRSLRLSLAESFHLKQKPLLNRILLCVPLILIVCGLLYWSNSSAKSFQYLWNYFAWGNQVLAVFTFLAATVWLLRRNKNFWIALLPGMFMMFVVTSYILWTSPAHHGPAGCGMELQTAYSLAAAFTVFIAVITILRGKDHCNIEGK